MIAVGALAGSTGVPRAADSARPSLAAIHAEHARFVWATLHRMGVREADLDDMLQEVFVVVHRRLHTWDGTSRITTWLFGICLKVAAAHRRRAHVRHEQIVREVPDAGSAAATPEDDAARRQARARLEAILDRLDLDKRVVFVMFEIEERSCADIAEEIGVPVGTVYSRLHAARSAFAAQLARLRATEARESGP